MNRDSQRGVAVVMALLVTALAVTLVTGIFWQQQIMVRGIEGQRLHLQHQLSARAGLDVARMLLQEAATHSNVTALDEAWRLPLLQDTEQGGRLAQQVADAQACFNLRNLIGAGGVDLYQVTAFSRLLAALRLDGSLAYSIAAALAAGPEQLELQQLDDLRGVPGMSEEALARLRDFVVILPVPTAINVNTAPPEVLTSVVNFSLQEARALAEQRRQANFRGQSDFALRLNDKETLEGVSYAVTSDYFTVQSTLTQAGSTLSALHTAALIRRGGSATLLWTHYD
jgi:general secretion pathway protein K